MQISRYYQCVYVKVQSLTHSLFFIFLGQAFGENTAEHENCTHPIALMSDFGCRTSEHVEICRVFLVFHHTQWYAGQNLVVVLIIYIPWSYCEKYSDIKCTRQSKGRLQSPCRCFLEHFVSLST